MHIEIAWRTPVDLIRAPRDSSQDYVVPSKHEQRIPESAGVYVFARKFGVNYEPIYIGQADDLRSRIGEHLKKNVALMRALRNAKSGTRSVLLGEIRTKQGQQVKRVLKIVERALIAEAVASGHTLVNKQLTSERFHTILSTGSTTARGPFVRSYSIPIT